MRLDPARLGVPSVVSPIPFKVLESRFRVNMESLQHYTKRLPKEQTIALCAKLNTAFTLSRIRRCPFQGPLLSLLYQQNWLELSDQQTLLRYSRSLNEDVESNILVSRHNCLELIRWIASLSAFDERSFSSIDRRRSFARALLLASQIWTKRTQDSLFEEAFQNGSNEEQWFELLRSVRENQMWMVAGVANPIWQLGRAQELFLNTYFVRNSNFKTKLESELEMRLDDYLVCVTAIASLTEGWQRNYGLIGNLEFYPQILCTNIPGAKSNLDKFLALASQDLSRLKASYEPKASTLMKATELRPIRERPIFLYENSQKATILDFVCLLEKSSNGLIFATAKLVGDTAIDRFGKAFEEYGIKHLDQYTKMLRQQGFNVLGFPNVKIKNTAKEFTDYAVIEGDTLVLVEMKASFIKDDAVEKPTAEAFWKDVCEKYVFQTETSSPKGVGQIAKSIRGWLEGTFEADLDLSGIKRVFPVLMVFDPHLSVMGNGRFLAKELRLLISADNLRFQEPIFINGVEVHDLCVITIDECEYFNNRILTQSLCQLLHMYSGENPSREVSLGSYLCALPKEPNTPEPEIIGKTSAVLQTAAEKLFGIMAN